MMSDRSGKTARGGQKSRFALGSPGTIGRCGLSSTSSRALSCISSEALDRLAETIDRGLVGVKSGEGFYRYPRPVHARPDFVTSGLIEGTPSAGADPSATTSTTPELPCLLLRPPGVGPLVSQVDTRLFKPQRKVSTAGTATIQADPGETWAGLLPLGGGLLAATFDELSGHWILLQTRLSSSSTVIGALRSLVGRFRDRAR